jgi:hypothetical protein
MTRADFKGNGTLTEKKSVDEETRPRRRIYRRGPGGWPLQPLKLGMAMRRGVRVTPSCVTEGYGGSLLFSSAFPRPDVVRIMVVVILPSSARTLAPFLTVIFILPGQGRVPLHVASQPLAKRGSGKGDGGERRASPRE